jgi:hypothetical protein
VSDEEPGDQREHPLEDLIESEWMPERCPAPVRTQSSTMRVVLSGDPLLEQHRPMI